MRRFSIALVLLTGAGIALLHAQTTDPTVKLLKLLKSKKADKRIEALHALAELGPKAAPAVAALAELVPGLDEETRVLATMALGKIGKASIPAAAKLLDYEDETTRYYAVWALAIIGKDANELTPRLLKMLEKDDDEDVRIKAGYALARIAPESKEARALLVKATTQMFDWSPARLSAITELRHFGPEALEPLVKTLGDMGVSAAALESIHHILDQHKNDAGAFAALPHIAEILKASNTDLPGSPASEGLTFVLAKFGAKLLLENEKKLTDKDLEVRKAALLTIANLGDHLHTRGENPALVAKTLKVLLPFFKHPERDMRMVLATGTPLTETTQAGFEELLIDDANAVRTSALAKLQLAGVDPFPKLKARFMKATGTEQIRIAVGLFSLNAEEVTLKLLWDNLAHKDPRVRHMVVLSLCNLPMPTIDKRRLILLPVLLESLKSANAERRLEAAEHLPPFQSLLRDSLPTLLGLLDDPSVAVRRKILEVLGAHVEADPKTCLKKLLPLLEDPDEEIRFAAVHALFPLRSRCVADLARLVERDKSEPIWSAVCQHLELMKKDAKAAIPLLLKAAQDEERWGAVTTALAEIAPDETFGPLLEMRLNRDEPLRKALGYEKAIRADRRKLLAALLEDGKSLDGARRLAVVSGLQVVMPMLPVAERVQVILTTAPLMTAQLVLLEKELKSKDAKVRIEAARLMTALREGANSLEQFAVHFSDEKKHQQFMKAHVEQHSQFEKLILLARVDPELQVRREARKTETLGDPNRFNLPPGMFGPFPPGNFFPGQWFPLRPGPGMMPFGPRFGPAP